MKKILILLSVVFLSNILIKCVENRNEEPIEKVQTRTETRTKAVNNKALTKDKESLEFDILYEGDNEPRDLLEGHIDIVIRQMVFDKYVLELLKYNSLAHLGDSLEYYITPLDSTFRVLLINTKYHLSPEVRELWDEYIKAKTEESKTTIKNKNLEILYRE